MLTILLLEDCSHSCRNSSHCPLVASGAFASNLSKSSTTGPIRTISSKSPAGVHRESRCTLPSSDALSIAWSVSSEMVGTSRNLANPRIAVSGSNIKSSMKNNRTRSGSRASASAQAHVVTNPPPVKPGNRSPCSGCVAASSSLGKLNSTSPPAHPCSITNVNWSSFMIMKRGSLTRTAIRGGRPSAPFLCSSSSLRTLRAECVQPSGKGFLGKPLFLQGNNQGGACVASKRRLQEASMTSMNSQPRRETAASSHRGKSTSTSEISRCSTSAAA
mmetsp:Transcript_70582/g.132076  ORF Transcript_70582/g.132076 Transcript_70582/m.132076 type:complete len:274 (-) Transcript_70582:301-1122(-)